MNPVEKIKGYEELSDLHKCLLKRYLKDYEIGGRTFVFDIILCDNDINKDNEKFSIKALFQMEKLFIGKTGFCGFDYQGKNILGRIFNCKVECDFDRSTTDGEPYCYLKATAFIKIDTPAKDDIASAIRKGYYKEVNVGCSVIDSHMIAGNVKVIDKVSDAYEWTLLENIIARNCPLKNNNGECFNKKMCTNVSKVHCEMFRNIYNLGASNKKQYFGTCN